MNELRIDVAIIGGGLGAYAAALAWTLIALV
jgi:hypothetical protein